MKLFRYFASIITLFSILTGIAQARVLFQSEFFSEHINDSFIIDAGNDVNGDISLQFGQTLGQFLTWDVTNNNFLLSNDLHVLGDILTDGMAITLGHNQVGNPDTDVDIVAEQGSESSGVLRYDDGENRWKLSNDNVSFFDILSESDTFQGASHPGIVPDPNTEQDFFLRDDGTWSNLYTAKDIGFITIPGSTTGTIHVTSVGFESNFVEFTLNNDIESQNFDSQSPVNQSSQQGSFGWGAGYAYDDGNGIKQQSQFFSGSSNSINGHRSLGSNSQAIMIVTSDQNGNDIGRVEGALTQFTPSGFDLNITTNTLNDDYVVMYSASAAAGTEIQFIDAFTDNNSFTIDHDNTGGDVTLQFGQALDEYLRWNDTTHAFDLSDDLNLGGNEIQNARIENSVTDPATCDSTQVGRLYFNTTDNLTYICDGNSWQPLGSSSSGGDMTAVQGRRTTSLTPSYNTWTDVDLDTTDFENNSSILKHDTPGNTDRIIIGETGLYEIFYRVNHESSSQTHELNSRVRINDNTVIGGSLVNSRDYRDEYSPVADTFVTTLHAGDYITLQVQRVTDATISINTTLGAIRLKGEKGDKGDTGNSVETGSSPPFPCVSPKGGSLWYDTTDGQTYVCDTSNGRNSWLSQNISTFYGESNGTCQNGQDAGNSDPCNVDWGDSLGAGNNSDLGLYIPQDIVIVGYGFSELNTYCTTGSFDIEVWSSTGANDDNNYSLASEIATGLQGQVNHGTNLNKPISGNRYILWGLDNNCSQSMPDWNVILYYRVKGS